VKKYKTGGWNTLIEVVEVLKETDKTVTILESFGKHSRERRYFKQLQFYDTFNDAKQALINSAREKHQAACDNLARCEANLTQIEALEEPHDG
jgi:hypothetical protein